MKKQHWLSAPALLGVFLFLLLGCDGGSSSSGGCDSGSSSSSSSSSSTGGGPPVYLDGTISAKHLQLEGTVYLRDNFNPRDILTAQSNADGAFQFNVAGKTPPFLIWTTLPSTPGQSDQTLYSTSDGALTVNISPLTHLVSAMALRNDPVPFYQFNPEAGAPDEEAVAEATAVINALFALVYADLGIPADFNLMRDPMGQPNTGFQRLLDMVSVWVSGKSYTLYDSATLLSEDDMDDEIPAYNAGPEAARAIIMGVAAGRQYFSLLYYALEDGVVNADERDSISAWLAPDLLQRGQGPVQYMEALAGGQPWRAAKEEIDSGEPGYFLRMMHDADNHPLAGLGGLSEKGSYASGFWLITYFEDRGRVFTRQVGFVLTQGQWKMFGDRSPFDDDAQPRTVGIRLPVNQYLSGLGLAIQDKGRIGQNLGVRKVAIFNSALPTIANPLGAGTASAVVLTPQRFGADDDTFRIAEPAGLEELLSGRFYLSEDGLDLGQVAENSNYYYVALGDNNKPLYIWGRIMQDTFPAEPADLALYFAQRFPTITAINNSAPARELPFEGVLGNLTLQWSNPIEEYYYALDAGIEWWNHANAAMARVGVHEIANPALIDPNLPFGQWTTATFNPPPATWQAQSGMIWLQAYGPAGEMYIDAIDFEVIHQE